MKKSFSLFLSCFLLLASSFFVGCAKDYITGKKTLNFFSTGSDVELGRYVMKRQLSALRLQNKNVDQEADSEEFRRIRKIVNRIAVVSHIPTFPYEVHLADLDIVNAWAAPGGKIMVFTGLWQPRKGLVHKGNDEELAAVLGHEIAHATARHVTEMISQISTISLVGEIAASVIAGAGSPEGSDMFREIFYGGVDVYIPSYSRKNESEADAVGLMYMAMAGFNPQAAVNLWERAAKESKSDKTSIYASHPSSGERTEALKKLLPQAMEIYKAITIQPRHKRCIQGIH